MNRGAKKICLFPNVAQRTDRSRGSVLSATDFDQEKARLECDPFGGLQCNQVR